MSQPASPQHHLELAARRPLHDDGDGICTTEVDTDDAPTETLREVVPPFSLLNRGELADLGASVTDQVLVERAVGVLMLVYDLDADNAVELLTWGSRAHGITIPLLARQLTELTEDPNGRFRNLEGSAHSAPERVDRRTRCDDVLFSALETAGLIDRPTDGQHFHPTPR